MFNNTYLKVKLYRSLIRKTKKQKAMIKSLGLKRINQVVVHKNNSSMQGLIKKLSFLVKVID